MVHLKSRPPLTSLADAIQSAMYPLELRRPRVLLEVVKTIYPVVGSNPRRSALEADNYATQTPLLSVRIERVSRRAVTISCSVDIYVLFSGNSLCLAINCVTSLCHILVYSTYFSLLMARN